MKLFELTLTAVMSLGIIAASRIEAKAAQPVLEGKYRGGNDLTNRGCPSGIEGCQVGLIMQFGTGPQGQAIVNVFSRMGSAAYQALKDGRSYDGEPRTNPQPAVVQFASDGSFSFSYSTLRYENCRLSADGAQISCNFRNNSVLNTVVLYKGR